MNKFSIKNEKFIFMKKIIRLTDYYELKEVIGTGLFMFLLTFIIINLNDFYVKGS